MRKKLLFGFIAVVLVAGTILAGCAAPAPAEGPAPAPAEKVYEWRACVGDPRETEHFFECEEFAANVWEMSGGRLKVRCFGEGEILSAEEYFDAIAEGQIELADTNLAKQAGKLPFANVYYGLPLGISDIGELCHLNYDEGMDDWVREKLAPMGVYYLTSRPEGGFVLWSKEPIYRLADLTGMKIRAFGAAADMLAALGASVVYVPWPECYLAVTTGVVDSICTVIPGGYDIKLYEPCKGLLLTKMTPFANGCVMLSMDAWNELPDDLKAIVASAGRDWSYRSSRMITRALYLVAEMQEKHGVTVTTWPAEDVAEAMGLAKGVWGKMGEADTASTELLKMKLDYMKKIGYPID